MVRNRTPRGRKRTYERNSARTHHNRSSEYVSILADPKSRLQSTQTTTTSKSTIKSYLQRPQQSATSIAGALRSAYVSSGVISKVIDYYQSHPTYNYSISPILGNKVYKTDGNMRADYIDVAYGLMNLNIKFYAPYFFRETLIDGVTYFYKYEDATGVGYLKFPSEWCRVSNIQDGVYRFRIDMSKIKQEIYDMLPTELQQAYDTYHGGGDKDETKWYDNKWYYVEDGVAFTFDPNVIVNGGQAVSPFASVLLDSISLDKAKDNIEIKDNLDTVRILHSKVPVDSNGEPSIPLKHVKLYDELMKARLPEGVKAITTPTNVTNIPLNGAGNSGGYETVGKTLEQVFFDLGAPGAMFGGTTNSANVVKTSIKKDANWIYTNLFPMLESYYNYEISQIKTKSKAKWVIKFIRESNFTLKDDIASYKDQLSFGGSRMDYMAASGMNPEEIISKLEFEQKVLDIDSLMVVKPTSNTISSKNSGNSNGNKNNLNPVKGEVGRPKTDNPTDDTDRLDGGA